MGAKINVYTKYEPETRLTERIKNERGTRSPTKHHLWYFQLFLSSREIFLANKFAQILVKLQVIVAGIGITFSP